MRSKQNLHLPVETNSYILFRKPSGLRPGVFYFKGLVTLLLFFIISVIGAQPRMEIPETKKSFGTVVKGELVKLEYELYNRGNAPLIINEAEVSCSCTRVDFSKEPILPGQQVKIVVSFDTKTVYERQDRVVYLHSNDPKSPGKIRYKGFVKRK